MSGTLQCCLAPPHQMELMQIEESHLRFIPGSRRFGSMTARYKGYNPRVQNVSHRQSYIEAQRNDKKRQKDNGEASWYLHETQKNNQACHKSRSKQERNLRQERRDQRGFCSKSSERDTEYT